MELPFNDDTKPMFSDNSNDTIPPADNQGGSPIPQPHGGGGPHHHGTFSSGGYNAPLFRPEEFSGDSMVEEHSAQKVHDPNPQGSHHHSGHPPNCKNCGKPKLAKPAIADGSDGSDGSAGPANDNNDEFMTSSNSGATSSWKIILWVILGIVGLVTLVAILRCMSTGSVEEIIAPFSPSIPTLNGATVTGAVPTTQFTSPIQSAAAAVPS